MPTPSHSTHSAANVVPLIAGPPPAFTPGATAFPWWKQYEAGLIGHYGWPQRITGAALTELDTSTNDIHAAIPAIGSTAAWRAISFRQTSVVVGAIQSGKTRSMIGVAAKAFDRGFPLVVVLSGLKNDLREQTSRRFQTDLFQEGEDIYDAANNLLGYTHPSGSGLHGTRRDFWAIPSSQDAHNVGSLAAQIIAALTKREVVLLVVKKQKHALLAVQAALDATWLRFSTQPPPLFVIDDECDEASVPANRRAVLPGMISSLWANAAATQPVVYVGYTATPQANIFQNQTNPLYPQRVHTLRAPGDTTSSLTFAETGHPASWYSGTDLFFEWLTEKGLRNFFLRPRVTQAEFDQLVAWRHSELAEAVIAYLVAGAIRLVMTGKRIGVAPYDSPAHSMLVHTDVQRDEHWRLAEALCEICRPTRISASTIRGIPPHNRIAVSWMQQWLLAEPNRWRRWFTDYHVGFLRLQQLYANQYSTVPFPTWATICNVLHTHVFHHVKVKVINADSDADRLDFSRPVNASGTPQCPEDVFTIVIGGNVLSRGLTIEGLTVSYFMRWANTPLDDTTMQRQRWLGYRGSHLEFCRVFSSRSIIEGLRRASNADVAARQQMAFFAAAGLQNVKASCLWFQGAGKPTGKMGTARTGVDPTFTGAKPFVRFVQPETVSGGLCAVGQHNEAVSHALASCVRTSGTPRLNASGSAAGYVVTGMTALDAAACLDSFEYANHNPDIANVNVQAFDSVERIYGIPSGTLHRRPNNGRPTGTQIPARYDPYLIAAYLRLWHYVHDAIVVQRMPNRQLGSNYLTWNPCPAPQFNIVYRCGSKRPAAGSPLVDPLTDKRVYSDGTVHAAWGRSGQLDEEWFDLGAPPAAGPASPRAIGTNGLLMLYIIHRAALNATQSFDLPTFGVAIPVGGPSLRLTAAI